MAAVLVLLLIAVVFGLGFLAKALWIVALLMLVAWAVGFAFRQGEGHWYRW